MPNTSDHSYSIKDQIKGLLESEALFGVEEFFVSEARVQAARESAARPANSGAANVAQPVRATTRETAVQTPRAVISGNSAAAFTAPKVSAPPAAQSAPAISAPISIESRREQLQKLYAQYANCQNCPLGATRKKIVFGVGALAPKVLFVGEGPGFEEDRQGLPFVGKAGQLLDKIMASIGLDRENCHIANIVKCHPMKNPDQPEMRGNDRAPIDAEMAACRPILNRQLEILQPPIIVALGSVATKALLQNNEGITRIRGRVFDFSLPESGRTVPLIPTYHPAALLRNELLKKDVWQDMKMLRGMLQ